MNRGISLKIRRLLSISGPGLVTGASDDDPSGIATYSQAGAGFGLATLWTVLITFPLMYSIQEMCARIGIVTSKGLTGNLRSHYPKALLYVMLAFSFPAITLNIGADIAGMGAVATLLVPKVPAFLFSILFTVILVYVIIKFSYQKIAALLKWLCLVLLVYLVVPFLVQVDWANVFKHTFLPTIQFNKEFLSILVGIFGTTISPYLFFWQATMEAEDIKHATKRIIVNKRFIGKMQNDVFFGMFFSNLVMLFIILTAGVVLFNGGIHQIDTVEQAAKAIEPLAGKFSYLLFAAGVIGTGFLAIPVLAGSLSYIIAETFDWPQGMDKTFSQAPGFYITIIFSLVVGLLLHYLGISPVKALIYTAILYGITSPVLIALILHICNSKSIMKEFTNKRGSNILGFITLILMSAATIALLCVSFK